MSSPSEQLCHAAATGNLEQVQALLKNGAKFESDLEGRTALHLASANGHTSVAKALIDGGAKINALDAAGYSPLHQAAAEGHEEVVKLLLKNGCHVDTQDELHGNTSLHEAAWKGFSRTLETLCKHKGNVYIKNNGGFTPLHLACQNGHNQCCRNLLLAACKPDVRNNYGDTPLHTSARYGHAGVLRILISAFCNVNETNKNGDTALHISAAMGRNKLTRILLEAGSDIKIKNNQGETCRDIAERKEFPSVVKLMDNPPVTLIHVEEQNHKPSKKREKDSGTSQESATKEKKEKHKKSKKTHKVHFSDKPKKGNVSPYGCHMYPDMNYFPSIKLQSLPQDPLKTGEQYYADLAGNIKKGPRGLGYMCYCAPFFNHVEKKLDANKKELLDCIESRNDDLKAKISHLEQKTHDQLFSLNQKMKESLALERGECAERIDRRLFRERKELEQQQQLLQEELRMLRQQKKNTEERYSSNSYNLQVPHNGGCPNGYQPPLLRSKSEDLLSESNSHQNSMSLMSSTVTGTSRFTQNSKNGASGRPKGANHMSNISRLKLRCLGNPELKRESRSEGDLTSCHTDASSHSRPNLAVSSYPMKQQGKYPVQKHSNGGVSGLLWKNTQFKKTLDSHNIPLDFMNSKSKSNYALPRQHYFTNHNHDQNRNMADFKLPVRTNGGLPSMSKDTKYVSSSNGIRNDRRTVLPQAIDDGSSFV